MRPCTLVPLVLLATVGCATKALNDNGYRQPRYGYEVAYVDPATKALLGPDWQLDNYRYDRNAQGFFEKTGDAYVATREQDLDGDGSISEFERWKEAVYDLRFVSRIHNGVIWVKAHSLTPNDVDRALDVTLENYADGLSGTGLFAQANLFGVSHVQARSFTPFVKEKGSVNLGVAQGLAATIELGEAERVRQDPAHRTAIVRVVMAKLKFLDPVTNAAERSRLKSAKPGTTRWPVVRRKDEVFYERAALLVIGYHNTPSYFAQGRVEFDQLLGRVSFPNATVVPVGDVKPPADAAATAVSAP